MTMRFAKLLGLLSVTGVVGCASAYHSYSGCQVNCRYCPLPPLPYVSYPPCVCHSSAAMQHLSMPVRYVTPATVYEREAPPMPVASPGFEPDGKTE